MKCQVCGVENPEDKRFCGDCGSVLPRRQLPPEEQPVVAVPTHREGWLSTNWKAVAAVIIVLIVVVPSIGLIYAQPWSKIKVLVNHDEYSSVTVRVFIDGELKASVGVDPSVGWRIVGVWSVTASTHTVSIDRGDWYFVDNLFFEDYWGYEEPDGELDFLYDYQVGPLYTKNAYVQL